jgi:hypothetical protein
MLRRMSAMERTLAPFLISQDWEPFFPMYNSGVFSSRWPSGDKTIWTIVNRNEYNITGYQMELPFQEGMRYYDLYHGRELTPVKNGNKVILSFELELKGFGCVLAAKAAPDSSILSLMTRMKGLTALPLASFSNESKILTQRIIPIERTKPSSKVPLGMIKIPAGEFNFKVQGIAIEGANAIGVDVQYPWEDFPRQYHQHVMSLKSFWIDKYPVTNAQVKIFLDATNFL